MLKVEKLYVSFTKEYYTLNNISIHLKHGQKIVVLGSKESGRTALLRSLLGLENKAKGEIYFKNVSIDKIDFENDISIGYLPANIPFLENKTVKQNIEYILKIRDKKDPYINVKVNNAIVGYGLDYHKNKKVKELSYLERLKLALARLSIRNIELFLIDDVFAKILKSERPKIIKSIKDLIRSNGASAIIMTEEEEIASEFGYDKKYMVYGSLQDTKDIEEK
jgi:ABC-type multidrug transport system ATPase subunit